MEKMGYGDQPCIVFRHDDIRRSHIHIVSVRVDRDGKKTGSAFEARRLMKILREIERKYSGMRRVKTTPSFRKENELMRKIEILKDRIGKLDASD